MKKDKVLKEFKNYLDEKSIENFKEEYGIIDEGKVVSEKDLVKIDSNGNIIEE